MPQFLPCRSPFSALLVIIKSLCELKRCRCYLLQTKLRKGNVFRSMCQEFCPWGDGMYGRGVCMAGCVHGRGCTRQGACRAGGCAWQEHAWQGGMHGRGAWQGGMHGRGVHGGGHVWQGSVCGRGCMAGDTATAADGMHPTGMHSCIEMHDVVKWCRISNDTF